VALITGGSSGIGLEISKQLGLHGAKVVITGRRREVLDAAVGQLSAAGVTATGLQGDVRSPEACQGWVRDTVQQFGHLDILVNCAAGNFLANAAELSQGGFKTGVYVWVAAAAACIGSTSPSHLTAQRQQAR
jgi:peroxisomal 2,4-dienoyl-CoA reductase